VIYLQKRLFLRRTTFFIAFINFGKKHKVKNSKHKFLKVPQILGGKETLNNYIESNLIYPEEAINKRIEGIVHLIAEINDNGEVTQIEIVKGLEGGCNEEATRLIRSVKFGAVKNKSVRLKTKKRFKVQFKLPVENTISYHFVENKEKSPKTETLKNYSYSIQITEN
jgi:TonB family protein